MENKVKLIPVGNYNSHNIKRKIEYGVGVGYYLFQGKYKGFFICNFSYIVGKYAKLSKKKFLVLKKRFIRQNGELF
jgi:hypothetical protein